MHDRNVTNNCVGGVVVHLAVTLYIDGGEVLDGQAYTTAVISL